MSKKEYIQPHVDMIDICGEQLLAGSGGLNSPLIDKEDDMTEDLSKSNNIFDDDGFTSADLWK